MLAYRRVLSCSRIRNRVILLAGVCQAAAANLVDARER